MSDPDPAATYERLKIETAQMLNLDAASLSLVENLQLDLVSLLRLEVDGLQGAVLAGDQVDLARLSTALGMLRQLLPEKALVAPAPAPAARFDGNARERLRRLIETTVLAGEADEAVRMADVREREEMAACAAAAPDGWKPAGGVARDDSDVPHPLLVAPAAPASGTPAVAPASPPRPQRLESDVERMDRINSTPALPPRGEPEEWRKHISPSGEIIAPWFRPYG